MHPEQRGAELGGRHLNLPGDELDHLVRKLHPAPRELPVLSVVLQQLREPQPRRAPLPRHELEFFVQHRPVLDQLVHAHRLPPHGHTACRRTRGPKVYSIKAPPIWGW